MCLKKSYNYVKEFNLLNIDEGMTRYLPSGSSLCLMLDTHRKLDCYIHWLKKFISGNLLRYVFIVFLLFYLKGINFDQTLFNEI